jgi:hypothetical protein
VSDSFDAQARLMDDAVFAGILDGIKDCQEHYGPEADISVLFCGCAGAFVRLMEEYLAPGVNIRQAIDAMATGMHALAQQTNPELYQ